MTEPRYPRNPTPADQARSLRETLDRWEDGLSTVEITHVPKKPMPVPDETRYWDEPVEGEDDEE